MPPSDVATTNIPYRTVPGATPGLAYLVGGREDGRPLVLLHGLSAHSSSWMPVFRRFGAQWRVYALDIRGHGRSEHDTGRYHFRDFCADAERLLEMIGEAAIVVGHSLGALVAAALAQQDHPLVAGVVLEDPPLYVVAPEAFVHTGLARSFPVLRDHIQRLRAQHAGLDHYRDLIAASPHPAGDRQGDHLLPDALWSRAESLALMDLDAITATLDGRTFREFEPDRPILRPCVVLRADAAYDPAFRPQDETRLHHTSPHVDVIEMTGAAHNIRGDRATRGRYLDELGAFLSREGSSSARVERAAFRVPPRVAAMASLPRR